MWAKFAGLRRMIAIVFLCLLAGPFIMAFTDSVQFGRDWRTADRSSSGIAPDPQQFEDAVVQVYAARAFNWRAMFAVHTWIATKPKGAAQFTVHHALGWRTWRNLPVVVTETDLPDRYWYGADPEVIVDVRGPAAAALIPYIQSAIDRYPYAYGYRLWPGPNSNTFVAYVGRQVPELTLDLPPTAIGKDFLEAGNFIAPTPSGSGFQLSLYGVFGFLISNVEGFEINVLGLGFGANPMTLAIRLPGVGTASLRK